MNKENYFWGLFAINCWAIISYLMIEVEASHLAVFTVLVSTIIVPYFWSMLITLGSE